MPEQHLRTPFVYLDLDRVRANIAAMQARAATAGVRLRPHSKTHKSAVIARWQMDAGAVGICCAKLGEAEVMAAAGIPAIRLPYPIHPTNADRVLALLDRTRLSIIVDDLEVATAWSAAMTKAGRSLEVLVKVDVGFHRCGIDPGRSTAADMVARVAGLPGLTFRGLLSHAGHAYHAASHDDLRQIALAEAQILSDLASGVETLGVEVTEISVGSTPSARFIVDQTAHSPARARVPTEMRPGNYVFLDRTQVGLGAATLESCAMWVEATVVSRPAPDRVILDCGSKTLTNDGARGFTPLPGHGLVVHLDGAPDPSLVVERLSEEHATVRATTPTRLRTGDRVRVLPNHACVVTNLMDEIAIVAGGRVTDRIRVDARGRIT
jgi:D-serine deaminase-like pyridoxal phosphate-dependent protein